MTQIERLLVGGLVVTMDEAFQVFPDGAVAIAGDTIAAVGPRAALESQYQADEVIDCAGKIVMPGLINAHCHAPMTLLRGVADDLRLDVWLLGYMMPTEREFVSPEFCRLGTLLACAEMIRSGITAFADMYYFEADIAAAVAEAGMRGVLGETVMKFPAPDAPTYEDSLAYCRRYIEAWRGHPLVVPAVAPHAPYSNTEETLRLCVDLAVEYDVPLLIHLAETRLEVDDSLRDHGQTVVTRMRDLGLFKAQVLAAHCVHIDHGEMRTLRDHDATAAHCPTSNLKLASGIAPVADMLAAGVTVGIGTDGPASNNDLDMFEEIRLAAILAKTEANDPTALPARQALLMATRQGAEALFLGDITGSLAAGKRADLIILDARPLHNTPQFDRDPNAVYSRIVYAGHASDVESVMVNGVWLMRDRQLLTIDEAAVKREAEVVARRIDQFLTQRERDVLRKLLAIGGLQQTESFEIQVKAPLEDSAVLDRLLKHPDVQIIRHNHYRQYDTYFLFDDPAQGALRYREDHAVGSDGQVVSVRSRLTLTTMEKERSFGGAILQSHARFIADADRPLRFYREYFQPSAVHELNKDRLRWHLLVRGVLFYINVDRVTLPELPGLFIEIKSRTWSDRDAEHKAEQIAWIMDVLGIKADAAIPADYLEMQGVD
ncbi:MAG: amidohydrolase family protein [Candidatus Flexifilum sp.]